MAAGGPGLQPFLKLWVEDRVGGLGRAQKGRSRASGREKGEEKVSGRDAVHIRLRQAESWPKGHQALESSGTQTLLGDGAS